MVLLAGGLVLAECIALVVAAGWEAVASVTGVPDDPATAWVAVALGMLAAAGLLLVARGLARRRRWARSPALVTQLLLLPVGVSLLQSGRLALGGALLTVALAGVVLLLSPPAQRLLDDAGETGTDADGPGTQGGSPRTHG